MSTVKRAWYVIALPFLWALYGLSFLVRRKPNRIAFGALRDTFSDNSRYAFIIANESLSKQSVEIAWVSGSDELVSSLRAQGFSAYHRWSLRGLLFTLTSRTFVTSSYLSDVNFWTSGGCAHLSLWHGVPLKTIERDISTGPIAKQFRPGPTSVIAHLAFPQRFRVPNRLVSPCSYSDEIFCRAFSVPEERLLRSRYPRSSHLLEQRARQGVSREKRIAIYCPTWRDADGKNDTARLHRAIVDLERICTLQGYRLSVKLHPNIDKEWRSSDLYSQLRLDGDLYDGLAAASLVITDYSSILFECLQAHIPLALYSYDGTLYEEESRDLYINPREEFSDIWIDDLHSCNLGSIEEASRLRSEAYLVRFGFYREDHILDWLRSAATHGGAL